MKNSTKLLLFSLLASILSSRSLEAGVFLGTTSCGTSPTISCQAGVTQAAPQFDITPFGIVHPFGFNQAGGSIAIRICVDSDPGTGLAAATQWAAALWNGLQAKTENCFRCTDFEEGDVNFGTSVPWTLASTLTHELGHCALALDHGNRLWNDDADPAFETTSYTLSYGDGAGGIDQESDGIRGSFDDTHVAPFAQIPDSVFWFRNSTVSDPNNPIVVDSLIVDSTTFSRSVVTGLPAVGHEWSANANRRVAESLGHGSTQSIMYSTQNRGIIYNGFSADDVNTTMMGRTGVDRLASTADDYPVTLSVVSCADPHEIRIRFLSLDPDGPLAQCWTAREFAYAQNPANARDYELVLRTGDAQLEIEVNSDIPWEVALPIFGDGFGSGNFDGWSAAFP